MQGLTDSGENHRAPLEWTKLYASDVSRAKGYAWAIGRAPLAFVGMLAATMAFLTTEPTHAIDTGDAAQMNMYRAAITDYDAPDENATRELLAALDAAGFLTQTGRNGDLPVYASPRVNESLERRESYRERGAKGGRAKAARRKARTTTDTQAATGGDYDAPNGY